MWLIDTNILIYAMRSEFAWLRKRIADWAPSVSVISYVEALGYHAIRDDERMLLEEFFVLAESLPLDHAVLVEAVRLRRARRIKLADSLIAATALFHGLTLVTRNIDDFRGIEGMALLDPFEDPSNAEGERR